MSHISLTPAKYAQQTNAAATLDRIPLIFDADDMIAHLEALDPMPTADEMLTAMARVGRIDNPYMIDLLADTLGSWAPAITDTVHHAWSSAEYPEDSMEPDRWAELFEDAGYRIDGAPADRPDEITLYRGAPEGRVQRMAWTSSLAVARKFAHSSLRGREEGRVWSITIPGAWLLAHISDREEHEYIVNPAVWAQSPRVTEVA